MTTNTQPLTTNTLTARYATDIAFVAEDSPATTLDDFTDQLRTASSRLEDAGINNGEDLDTAATYLADAANLTGTSQTVLLDRARQLLSDVPDMVDEYRDMV